MKELTKVKIEKTCIKGLVCFVEGEIAGQIVDSTCRMFGIGDAGRLIGCGLAMLVSCPAGYGTNKLIDKGFEKIELEAVQRDMVRGLN